MAKKEPFKAVVEEATKLVVEALGSLELGVSPETIEALLEEPPTEALGDLALPCFRISKEAGLKPAELAESLAKTLKVEGSKFFKKCENVSGYLNFKLDMREYARVVLESILNEKDDYGMVKSEKPIRIVVEHTSANPIHPLHIGHARNSVLGDTLYRLLKARGHTVYRRFFINDMGRQVALLTYGYRALGRPSPKGKPDVFYGKIYSITNTIVEIDRLKSELKIAEMEGKLEEAAILRGELDEWLSVAAELRAEDPQLFDGLAKKLVGRDHEAEISKIMRNYELRLDEEIVRDVRGIVSQVVEGFKETLSKLGVEFDFWDWESDVMWGGYVDRVLEEASKSPHYTMYKGAPALSFNKLQEDLELRRAFEIPKTFTIPPLILKRSDGTTLYPTRDIAYSILKFENPKADKVINVIMSEQKLPQLQIRLALVALGFKNYALNMIHYSYEIVSLPGQKMSSRKGRYVSLDSLLEEAYSRAREVVECKGRSVDKEEVAKAVGVGALRYTLASVSASKPLIFNWEDALSLEKNSCPYLQYTHARASSILRKGGQVKPELIDYSAVEETASRRRLVKLLGKWPSIFVKACEELKPEIIIDYLASLSDEFNAFYNVEPVLKEKDVGKKMLKLGIVFGVKVTISNALKLLGITPLEEM